jgi:hypothetical protein
MSHGEMRVLAVNKSELLDCFVSPRSSCSRLRGRCANGKSNSSRRELGEEANKTERLPAKKQSENIETK